ncbi:glycosyltransferase [Bradyrhizobium prioriisuperbiae]|uniref:glycosyltransferase n=1 Tax=Bradyrhizobium prioriisuperbiae TaxID=2854389 RepID=UPI0028E79D6C|nr:glycosyltransferase [Bradyrhizobium prioritasuperba]
MSVSVVMPAKNAAAYIGEAITSVLTQGNHLHELIVVDDGSSDNTIAIVRGFDDPRIRLLTNAGTGVSSARNAGARSATADWLMFLDADDRLRINALEILVGATTTRPDAVAIYGDYDRIDGNGRPIGKRSLLRYRQKPSGNVLERLVAGNFIVNGGIMIARSSAFAAVGGFDEALRYCEDWHCWCRLAALGELHFVPGCLMDYRVHGTNTMSAARTAQDFMPAVERIFNDRLISPRLPAQRVPTLRRMAEVHLMIYAAAQAVRFGRYAAALSYVSMIGRTSPSAVPRAITTVGLAYFGT